MFFKLWAVLPEVNLLYLIILFLEHRTSSRFCGGRGLGDVSTLPVCSLKLFTSYYIFVTHALPTIVLCSVTLHCTMYNRLSTCYYM